MAKHTIEFHLSSTEDGAILASVRREHVLPFLTEHPALVRVNGQGLMLAYVRDFPQREGAVRWASGRMPVIADELAAAGSALPSFTPGNITVVPQFPAVVSTREDAPIGD